MKLTRRNVLRGAAGVVFGLPALESFGSRKAFAAPAVDPYVIFFRQGCGVQQQSQNEDFGEESDRFWPRATGALTEASMTGKATGELSGYMNRLLLTRVNTRSYDFGDGHASGAMQALTAAGPLVAWQGGGSEASSESLDHRIGRELNPGGQDSLVMYAGQNSGWLGGACMSYRAPGQRRSALHNPWNAYQSFVSDGASLPAETQAAIAAKGKSVNDLVRAQMSTLMAHPRLSTLDKQRLELHLQTVRDLEVELVCQMTANNELTLQGEAPGFDSTDGDEVLQTARLHMDVAALAVACGQTRSVLIQVGNGNDGTTRYRDPDNGTLMDNYHYISHRRQSHSTDGAVIANSDLLHHKVDVQFAQTFRHLLDRLDAYPTPDGSNLLDAGMSVWFNDLGDGPPHSPQKVPYVIAGSAGGQLQQGQYVDNAVDESTTQHRQLLNTIGAAVGLTNASGNPLDDFGDPESPGGRLTNLLV